jgi:hypothetical protein
MKMIDLLSSTQGKATMQALTPPKLRVQPYLLVALWGSQGQDGSLAFQTQPRVALI